jgi:hypothetical protein
VIAQLPVAALATGIAFAVLLIPVAARKLLGK